MTNAIGSDSEMQSSNPSTPAGTGRGGGGPEPEELGDRKIGRLATPLALDRTLRAAGDLGGLPLSQLAQGSSDMSF
jgi:hypothetical protein